MIKRIHPLNIMASPVIEPSIIGPICAPGDSMIVAGGPGCGKTQLAADLIVAWSHPARSNLALGGLFYINSAYSVCQKVAIIDGENTQDRWQTTISRKVEAERLDSTQFRPVVEYVRPSDIGLHQASGWTENSEYLAQALSELNVALVIVDTLGRMWSPEDLNRNDWVQRGLAPFRSACQELDITVIALAHTRRTQGRQDPGPTGPLGSTLQEAQVDTLIMMDSDKDGRGCSLSLRKCRRAPWIRPGSTVTLRFTDEFGYTPQTGWEDIWPHAPQSQPSSDQKAASYRDQLVEYLRSSPGTSFKSSDLAKAIGCDKRTISNHLKTLGNRVVRSGSGRSTSWKWT